MGIKPLPQCKYWINSPTHYPSATAPNILYIRLLILLNFSPFQLFVFAFSFSRMEKKRRRGKRSRRLTTTSMDSEDPSSLCSACHSKLATDNNVTDDEVSACAGDDVKTPLLMSSFGEDVKGLARPGGSRRESNES